MRSWRALSKKNQQNKAFNAGIEALRADLSETFRKIGSAEMNGYTALEIVKNSKSLVARGTSRETSG
jgi:hypothetical protein